MFQFNFKMGNPFSLICKKSDLILDRGIRASGLEPVWTNTMTTHTITTHQLEGLPDLHRAVAMALIQKRTWRLVTAKSAEHDEQRTPRPVRTASVDGPSDSPRLPSAQSRQTHAVRGRLPERLRNPIRGSQKATRPRRR